MRLNYFLSDPIKYQRLHECHDDDYTTVLHVVCGCDCSKIVKIILDDGRFHPNVADKWVNMPLNHACAHGRVEIVRILLVDPRIIPYIPNNDGMTPFYSAYWNGNLEIIKILLSDP